ncbi:MAG: terpene cyclase/mutase family protein [Planctomycetaceae bacterium]|nr:terpene cyclase/mutase family protein [Planctomycetaceae bacterium]
MNSRKQESQPQPCCHRCAGNAGRILSAAVIFVLTMLPGNSVQASQQEVNSIVQGALDALVTQQKRQGYWEAEQGQYRVAMTALAGTAMLAEGSTATTGRYAPQISRAVDYLLSMSRPNGLIGYREDYHYTYGHGFSMVFLSQVYGEEEDIRRREEIHDVLKRAVQFCADAQTSRGGWGYVSAKEGNDFDEGSTCITQVQGLRACRNAGIPVSREIIDRAKQYIAECTTSAGGVQYSIRGGGERPPITAAALAALFNAGEYDTDLTRRMREYCNDRIWPRSGDSRKALESSSGHWHYMHFYYSQVIYRQGGERWNQYRTEIEEKLLREVSSNGGWSDRQIGEVYTTAINCIILQLDKGFLPIYQR